MLSNRITKCQKWRLTAPRALYTVDTRQRPPLEHLIANSIKATGPIPVSTYMQLCLGHPTLGYYTTRDPLGKQGDFITSPEISQLFGELIAIWFISALGNIPRDKLKPLRLVELGPGRGTLMSDILRIIRGLKLFSIHSVHLVETSLVLRSKQARTLEAVVTPFSIAWHDHLDQIPTPTEELHTLVIANEFFDALPINIFERAQDGWHEVLIDNAPPHETPSSGSNETFRFIRSHSPIPVPAFNTNPRFNSLPVGARVEYSRASTTTIREVAKLISGDSAGMAFIADYGGEHLFGDSFRGIKDHRISHPLNEPGYCDLTANVDFASLKDALLGIPKIRIHGPTSQREFLLHMGLEARLAGLMRGVAAGVGGDGDGDEKIKRLRDGATKLIDSGPSGMGIKFQILGVTSGLEVVYPWI